MRKEAMKEVVARCSTEGYDQALLRGSLRPALGVVLMREAQQDQEELELALRIILLESRRGKKTILWKPLTTTLKMPIL